MRRYARKLDATQKEIAQGFLACGWSVLDLSGAGSGTPDLLLGKNGCDVFVEAKANEYEMRGARNRPTDIAQRKFAQTWRGCPVIRAKSFAEALPLAEAAIRLSRTAAP